MSFRSLAPAGGFSLRDGCGARLNAAGSVSIQRAVDPRARRGWFRQRGWAKKLGLRARHVPQASTRHAYMHVRFSDLALQRFAQLAMQDTSQHQAVVEAAVFARLVDRTSPIQLRSGFNP